MTKRVLLAGAPTGCWTNLGDEAILAGMVASLRRTWPDAVLTVVSSNPANFLDRYDCRAVSFRDVEALVQEVASSDLVLLGGGSIFFDYWKCDPGTVLTPRHQGLSLWTGVALLAAAYGKPLMVYGAGVGPLHSTDGKLLAGAAFELARSICLRDRESRAAVDALGFGAFPAAVTGDAALAVNLPAAPTLDLPRPWLGVALRQWDVNADPERWQTEVAAALDDFIGRHGGSVLMVPCHRGVKWPLTDDAAAGESVRRRMARCDQVHHIDIERPWAERAALLASCDQVLAMRYHAALFALAAAVPTVAMGYDPKVESLLIDWGFEDLSVRLGDVDRAALMERLERARHMRGQITAMSRARMETLRARERGSLQQAAKLASAPGAGKRGGRAVHELLTRLAAVQPDRPPAAEQALARLRDGDALQSGADGGKRVAILTNRLLDRDTGTPCFGGAERYALELADLLRDLGLEPTFFQRGGAWQGAANYFGFPVVALPRGEHFSEFEPGVGEAFFRLTQDFDHVLYLAPNYASGPMREDAIVICHGVWWDHDLYRDGFSIRTPEWYEHLRRAFVRPKRVVSVDTNSINVIRALFPDGARRMALIPNYVDTERFHLPAKQLQTETVVLFPRRADVVRGVRLVDPILRRIPDRCRFRWVGDGTPGNIGKLRQVAARDARFELHTASFEDMPEVYRNADICVIPTVGSEGQSLACLEAMASGCAVVATRVGGLPELIRDGVDGLLCDPTPEAIADAIRRLLADPELRRSLGIAARAAAERQSLAVWRERWTQMLASLGWADGNSPTPSYDIICFSIINWEFRWQRPQQMMALWGQRGRRVFFLRIKDFLPPAGEPFAVRPLCRNVWEVTIALPEGFSVHSGKHPAGFVPTGLDALRALRQAFRIRNAVSVVELASWTPLACAARDAFAWPLVYDCMDDWSTFPGLSKRPHFLAMEEDLVSTADVTVVSSETIRRRWADRRPDILLARNAADFSFFRDAEGEDPLPDVQGPIAGFFGAIAEWFDQDLMAYAAKSRPDVTFVLVGGVHRVQVDELEKLPNVRFEGFQAYERMPDYLRRFDVCLVPFEVSPVTDGMDVVKFYEYISQGKPVVTTPIREILTYRTMVYLAQDKEDFVRQLGLALQEDDPALSAQRIELARQNSWAERLDRIEEAIGKRVPGPVDDPPAVPSTSVQPPHDQVLSLRRKARKWRADAETLQAELAARDSTIQALLSSTSWRITAPMRAASRALRDLLRSFMH